MAGDSELVALYSTRILALAADMPLTMGWPDLSVPARMVLALAMIAGRVETLAILALLTPEFWRR